ncbi:MAG: dihydroorotate dehydrogenase [Candidatus Neomarinimicrobiota bacterium]
MRTRIGSVEFANPIFVASGTYGYGTEAAGLTDISGIGAVITKSVTLNPRVGNPPPRIVETASGMINSIGLANIGIDRYLSELLPIYRNFPTAVIMNIAGSTTAEYRQVLEKAESVSSDIVGYEINISCPNVKEGGMEFGVSQEATARLTADLRGLTERLLIMKLSPNVTDISAIGKAAEAAGADAVSAINTLVGMSINPKTWQSNIFTTFGGLSGPAIKPVAIAAVHKLYRQLTIPVIGIGGITTAGDVVEFALAGATAVQIGTANFRDPAVGIKIRDDLEKYLAAMNLTNFEDIRGRVRLWS